MIINLPDYTRYYLWHKRQVMSDKLKQLLEIIRKQDERKRRGLSPDGI
jgi:hypothetical protein